MLILFSPAMTTYRTERPQTPPRRQGPATSEPSGGPCRRPPGRADQSPYDGLRCGTFLAIPSGRLFMKTRFLLAAGLLSFVAVADDAPHGIFPADINRQGNACTDFFDYANGNWR